MHDGSLTIALEPCSDAKDYWKSPQLFVHAEEQETFRYRYVVKYSKGLIKAVTTFFVGTFTGRSYEKIVQEVRARYLTNGMHQFDIFHNPIDPSRMRSVFNGQLFFIKMLCRELNNGGNLIELLIDCEHVGFAHPSFTTEDVKQFLKWVQDVAGHSRTPYQAVFLCSLLGQLVERGRNWQAGHTCCHLGKKCCDLILSSFGSCPYTLLPQSSLKFIKSVAEHLFIAGSSTGCLMFINYFCNLLDANYVMHVVNKLSSQTYTEHQFDKDVIILCNTFKLKGLSDRAICTSYLSYAVGSSPSPRCLWNIYSTVSRTCPGVVEAVTKEFISVYSKFISRRARKPDLLDPLFWRYVPESLQNKVASLFCKALEAQVLSDTKWSKERLLKLQDIIVDTRLHSSDDFRHFAIEVLTHKCKDVVLVLPDLLNSTAFCCYWKTVLVDADKEKVCDHWLKTSYRSQPKSSDRILAVVEACEVLCGTEALKSDKPLCVFMQKWVEREVVKMNCQSVMSAFQDGQNGSPSVCRHLMSLLRSAIKQHSGTGDRRSKYRQMIQLLGLDGPKEKKKGLNKAKLTRWVECLFLCYVLRSRKAFSSDQSRLGKGLLDCVIGVPIDF